jgi:hypothetical protein
LDTTWNAIIWNQFGAALDMMENAIRACPDDVWGNPDEKPRWKNNDVVGFWYVVYHTVFFTDYYLSDNVPSESDYAPPAPFTLSEFDYDALPDRVYTKDEILSFLGECRKKLARKLSRWTDRETSESSGIQYREDLSIAELLLYNMRHVQHHAAQLNLLLRQRIESAPDWVSRTKRNLTGES